MGAPHLPGVKTEHRAPLLAHACAGSSKVTDIGALPAARPAAVPAEAPGTPPAAALRAPGVVERVRGHRPTASHTICLKPLSSLAGCAPTDDQKCALCSWAVPSRAFPALCCTVLDLASITFQPQHGFHSAWWPQS